MTASRDRTGCRSCERGGVHSEISATGVLVFVHEVEGEWAPIAAAFHQEILCALGHDCWEPEIAMSLHALAGEVVRSGWPRDDRPSFVMNPQASGSTALEHCEQCVTAGSPDAGILEGHVPLVAVLEDPRDWCVEVACEELHFYCRPHMHEPVTAELQASLMERLLLLYPEQ